MEFAWVWFPEALHFSLYLGEANWVVRQKANKGRSKVVFELGDRVWLYMRK